jgi:hypothetical protein
MFISIPGSTSLTNCFGILKRFERCTWSRGQHLNWSVVLEYIPNRWIWNPDLSYGVRATGCPFTLDV